MVNHNPVRPKVGPNHPWRRGVVRDVNMHAACLRCQKTRQMMKDDGNKNWDVSWVRGMCQPCLIKVNIYKKRFIPYA